MKKFLLFIFLMPIFAFSQQTLSQQQQELDKLAWQHGPTKGVIGDKATIQVPQGYVFLGEQDTRRFIELMGNPPRSNHYLIAPKALNWFAVFEFDATGYVKDDEKIDADTLLKQLQESDVPSNEQRKKLGMRTLFTDGWQVPPHYDVSTKRLEWGVRLRGDDGLTNINYTSRLLSRSGVMSATLVADTETLEKDTREFKSALTSFDFVNGEKYSEFKAGDHVAEFGLAALVLGGAAAVATKKGFWTVIVGFLAAMWKVIAGVVVAGFAALTGLFKKKE